MVAHRFYIGYFLVAYRLSFGLRYTRTRLGTLPWRLAATPCRFGSRLLARFIAG